MKAKAELELELERILTTFWFLYLLLDHFPSNLGFLVIRSGKADLLQCCFPPNLSGHTCKNGFAHAQCGTAMSWDDGIRMSMQSFQHMSYNLFTCNCHSFVANCLNRLAYKGSVGWNVLKVIGLIHLKGQWVSSSAAIKSFVPFGAVMFIGVMMAGWPFVIGWATFSFLLFAWFIVGTYIFKGLIEC
ncbi:hypothetical protein O6H91_06G022700 [Diphasiastrum complanatum]|uniref:Uncharacterized protein n=1 Tax=Diphasiastrum complanatum TaxID=34168 RepID=A0ACC2DBE2_DIPCM|nr:hypothetical protein O6H91_06G022700 [Diphasiastrum complanatum]